MPASASYLMLARRVSIKHHGPRRIWHARLLFALALLVGILYFALLPSAIIASLGSRRLAFRHPIDDLLADAQHRWAEKVSSQSRTLEQAATEYTWRYGRPPPKGFDHWYEAAVETKSARIPCSFVHPGPDSP